MTEKLTVLNALEEAILQTENELVTLHITARMFQRAKLRGTDTNTQAQSLDGQVRHSIKVKKDYLKELKLLHKAESEVPTDMKEVLE